MQLQRRQEIVEEIQSKILSAEPLTDQDQKNIRRYGIRLTFKPKKKQRTQPNGGCENGVNCGERFKQIKEGELLTYLRNGWQIVHKLETGEVIVMAKT